MTKDLGRISELKIAIDTLYPLIIAFKTIDKELQSDHFEEALEIYEKAKTQLFNLKSS